MRVVLDHVPVATLRRRDTIGKDYFFGVLLDESGLPDNSKVPSVDPVHWRDRQRHNPGDGAYTNRYAFPKSGEGGVAHLRTGSYAGKDLYFSMDGMYDPRDYYPRSGAGRCIDFWDGTTRIQVSCSLRYGNPCDLSVTAQYFKYAAPYWDSRYKCWYTTVFQRAVYYSDSYHFSGMNWAKTEAEMASIASTYHLYSYDMPPVGYNQRSVGGVLCDGTEKELVPDQEVPVLSNEMDVLPDKLSYGGHSWYQSAMAEAYVRAVDALPHLGMNNIANVVETASLVSRMLFSGGLTSIGNISDAWLAYRYSYRTTRCDINEVAKMLQRLAALANNWSITSRSTVHDGDTTIRCSIELLSSDLKKVFNVAEKWGFALSASNAWDLLPYSFIVDWFLGVDDKLRHGEQIAFAYKSKVPAWFSIERDWINEYGFHELYYHRFVSRPDLSEAYLYRVNNDASGVTVVKRVLDTLAIVRRR